MIGGGLDEKNRRPFSRKKFRETFARKKISKALLHEKDVSNEKINSFKIFCSDPPSLTAGPIDDNKDEMMVAVLLNLSS